MLLVVLFSSVFSIINNNVVNGAITGANKYTDVMEDLQTDSNFNIDDYPVINNDYSIKVIAISESNENELFIYTYEPSGDTYNIQASTINISLELHNRIDVNNYGLTHLSTDGVFSKYLVNNLVVRHTQTTRYYEIVSIYRYYDKNIDGVPSGDNTLNEIVFGVEKMFTAHTSNGKTTYSVDDVEAVELTGLEPGLNRYNNGFYLYTDKAIDSHWVAFDVAFEIDKLFEADVGYTTQTYRSSWDQFGLNEKQEYGDPTPQKAQLTYKQKFETTDTFLFWQRTYKCDSIQSVQTFIETEELTEETINAIKDMQFVLRFAETEFSTTSSGSWTYHNRVFVTEVSVMRLKYEVDGKTYNMGVISNKVSDDGLADNLNQTGDLELRDGFEIMLAILLLILFFVIFNPILSIVFAFVGAIIKALWKLLKRLVKTALKLIVNILTFPFNMKGGKY